MWIVIPQLNATVIQWISYSHIAASHESGTIVSQSVWGDYTFEYSLAAVEEEFQVSNYVSVTNTRLIVHPRMTHGNSCMYESVVDRQPFMKLKWAYGKGKPVRLRK